MTFLILKISLDYEFNFYLRIEFIFEAKPILRSFNINKTKNLKFGVTSSISSMIRNYSPKDLLCVFRTDNVRFYFPFCIYLRWKCYVIYVNKLLPCFCCKGSVYSHLNGVSWRWLHLNLSVIYIYLFLLWYCLFKELLLQHVVLIY